MNSVPTLPYSTLTYIYVRFREKGNDIYKYLVCHGYNVILFGDNAVKVDKRFGYHVQPSIDNSPGNALIAIINQTPPCNYLMWSPA